MGQFVGNTGTLLLALGKLADLFTKRVAANRPIYLLGDLCDLLGDLAHLGGRRQALGR